MVLFKKQSREEDISRHAMEACEQILTEMGAELHDDLIQRLSIFRLYLDRLERSKNNPSETEALIVNMNADFTEVINAVRRISRRLMPVQMDGDSFEKKIGMLCQNLERPGGGTIHYSNIGVERSIPERTEVHVYRIIQELIHNAIKHSSAWHVWVRTIWENSFFIVEVEDDGTGLNKLSEFMDSLKKKHNSLRMRANVIGARVQYIRGEKGLLAKVRYRLPR